MLPLLLVLVVLTQVHVVVTQAVVVTQVVDKPEQE
jgi:hypothetical protein|uniref:Uncharacterized protein n=1 Tax=Picea glauca TaxID=3330 RepID=A0A117NH67_PICGL|nr:hypothetical protein ABT39_MTgene1455 [Picea glauca]KUM47914.1 hypothetical protein ABT39_MTgene4909 [Picea glauca]KUM47915.1 hypothetical protein ABT39_MTgene4910 [Picea glauca]QHR92433.1 hypothetical protein Q903MT_gene6479 [Picea sitchensis]